MKDQSQSARAPLSLSAASLTTYGGTVHKGGEVRPDEDGPHGPSSSSTRGAFLDDAFGTAVMHSVGALGRDEYVDGRGVVHALAVRKRDVAEKGSDEVEDWVEGGSMAAAIFGVVKGTVGPAVLYLPRGFQQAGWACAVPALVVATSAYVYSANRLLECWKAEDARQRTLARQASEMRSMLEGNDDDEDDRDGILFESKLLTYPELARRAFGQFSFLIEFGIAAMQFGVCLTYLIFVPANLHASCRALFGIAVPKAWFLIGMLLIEIPCTWIRDIRRLAPFNVVATLLIAYGLGSCLVISFAFSYVQKEETMIESLASLPAIRPAWFMFVGTAFFVFEGSITLVVPLQEAVYKEDDRAKFPACNQNVTICIVLFYMFFALAVWATFGDHVRTALTASLPQGNFSTSVQFAYSIAVILTYPLQAFPALEVLLKNCSDGDNFKKDAGATIRNVWRRRNFLASLLNVGLGIIAVVAIEYLGNVVSLLGSLVGMPIALVYPPLMHNLLVKGSPSWVRFANYSVSSVGLFATVAASYATIANWDEGAERR